MNRLVAFMLAVCPFARCRPERSRTIPGEIFVAEKPKDMNPLVELKKNAKDGDKVDGEADGKVDGEGNVTVAAARIFVEKPGQRWRRGGR